MNKDREIILGYLNWLANKLSASMATQLNGSDVDEYLEQQAKSVDLADVGGCTDLDIEDAASDCAEYYEKQSGEDLTAREKACFIDGYNVGGKAVRNRLTKKY